MTVSNISIELLDTQYANSSEEHRYKHVTDLAAISRGKHKSMNPEKRYWSLMKEAEGKRPSRPMEFLPVKIRFFDLRKLLGTAHRFYDVLRFSHIEANSDTVCTNMRALINAGVKYEDIPYNSEINDFIGFRIVAPMFAWAQITTHTQLSTEAQSDRVATEDRYWLPEDIEERTGYNKEEFIYYMLEGASQNDVQLTLKKAGYPKEIYSRAPYYFKMKEFVITGWLNDDHAWPHFLRERNAYESEGCKNWTQNVTANIAKSIRETLEDTDMYYDRMKCIQEDVIKNQGEALTENQIFKDMIKELGIVDPLMFEDDIWVNIRTKYKKFPYGYDINVALSKDKVTLSVHEIIKESKMDQTGKYMYVTIVDPAISFSYTFKEFADKLQANSKV